MKRIYTLLPAGENSKPIVVVASDIFAAFRAVFTELTEGNRIVAVQEGPEVEVID